MHSQINSSEEPKISFLGFVASALKKDNVQINQFYERVRYTTEGNLVKSFAWILWHMNSEYTLQVLTEMAKEPKQRKLKNFLLEMRDKEPVDISKLGLSQPTLLLSDFFATGSQETINGLLSKIDKYESQKWIEKQIAMNVVNLIRFHSQRDREILQYVKGILKNK